MIQAVWFDIGGTIHTQQATPENDRQYAEEVFCFLAQHGIRPAPGPAELLAHIDAGARAYKAFSEETLAELPTDQIWQQYFLGSFNLPAGAINGLGEELSYMYDRRRKVITRREGLAETLAALQAAGYRLGVISNIMSRSFVPRILQEYGIAACFEHLVLSSVQGRRKPHRALFDEAAAYMGLPAGALAYVGDTISRDVRGAKGAGWLMIQIDNPLVHEKDRPCRGCGAEPDHHITQLTQLPAILRAYS